HRALLAGAAGVERGGAVRVAVEDLAPNAGVVFLRRVGGRGDTRLGHAARGGAGGAGGRAISVAGRAALLRVERAADAVIDGVDVAADIAVADARAHRVDAVRAAVFGAGP